MIGGEIFIPIIPSIKITDLAKSMGKDIKTKIIGVRPGEKIHELLCSTDRSQNVRKLKNHFVMIPSYTQNALNKKYINNLGEKGITVKKNFEYNSGTNKDFLKIPDIKKLNNLIN